VLAAQLAEVGAHQPWQPSIFGQQPVGEVEDAAAASAGVQDDGQQLGCRERLGAEVLQAFAQTLMVAW
jgi:hypothetical protein